MKKRLRLLIISNNGTSSNKITYELSKAGFTTTSEEVNSCLALREQVSRKDWDIVLFDSSFSLFSSAEAYSIIHEERADSSIIIVSENDEDVYVMEAGVSSPSNYTLRCSMNNLGFAVQQELYKRNSKRTLYEVKQHFENDSELLSITLNSIGDGVITTDIQGKVTFMNRVGQQLTGYQLEDAKGKMLCEVFRILDKESRAPAEDPFLKVMQAGTAVGLKKNTMLLSQDGEERYISASISPITDKEGSFVGVIVVFRDITRIKKAEDSLRESEELYRGLFENASDVVITFDTKGRITTINKAIERMFGYKPEDIVGNSIFDYIVETQIEYARGMMETKLSNLIGATVYELQLYDKKRQVYTVEVSSQLFFKDGKPMGALAIIRDITIRKKAEEELQRAKEAAEMASKAKSEFLANMSHEIRTPLNGIMGMTELTMMTDLSDEQRENLKIVKNCAESLMNVINDILDFSKIEAGKMSISNVDFDLHSLVDKTMKAHSVKAFEKGLELSFEIADNIPRYLSGDPNRLQQILNNLIGNAVKFTEIGKISLKVDTVEQSDKEIILKFTVTDTGIGIEENEMARLFKSFSQVDSSISRKYGGTGLGLAISKRLVEMMGGNILVESKKGRGSVFCFTCIFKQNSASKIEYENKGSDSLNKNTKALDVLIVEDDKICQVVASKMVIENGGTVAVANNGQEALALLDTRSFDLILMDIQMPGMDGMETTRIIREKEKGSGRHIPVIALTAYALQGDKQKFINAGMDDYISKPIKMNEFIATINKYMHKLEASVKLETTEIESGTKEDMSRQFMSDVPQYMDRLKDALYSGEINKVERFAHIIKVLADDNDIDTVKRAAFKIELAARRNDLDGMRELNDALRIELDKTIKTKALG